MSNVTITGIESTSGGVPGTVKLSSGSTVTIELAEQKDDSADTTQVFRFRAGAAATIIETSDADKPAFLA